MKSSRDGNVIGAILVFLVGIFFLYSEIIVPWRLRSDGIKTDATVLEHTRTHRRRGSDGHQLKVSFADAGGQTRQVTLDVSKSMGERTGIGSKVSIIYLRSDPTQARPASRVEDRGWWPTLVVVLCFGLGAFIFLKR